MKCSGRQVEVSVPPIFENQIPLCGGELEDLAFNGPLRVVRHLQILVKDIAVLIPHLKNTHAWPRLWFHAHAR